MIYCMTCGEESGAQGSPLYGHCHKYGPVGHHFEPSPDTSAPDPVIGYDGTEYAVGDRVELHPGTDLWARGARFGEVVGISLTPKDRVRVKLDRLPRQRRIIGWYTGSADTFRKVR